MAYGCRPETTETQAPRGLSAIAELLVTTTKQLLVVIKANAWCDDHVHVYRYVVLIIVATKAINTYFVTYIAEVPLYSGDE